MINENPTTSRYSPYLVHGTQHHLKSPMKNKVLYLQEAIVFFIEEFSVSPLVDSFPGPPQLENRKGR